MGSSSKKHSAEINLADQGLRTRIWDYHPNVREQVRREYALNGLPFRGHDKSEKSSNKDNFLELLHWLCGHNENVKVVTLKNAPGNLKMISPQIQRDIVSAISIEIINTIIRDIDDSLFSILVDESRDISSKKQMTIVLRYADKSGSVIERFVGIEHVTDTSALSLKAAIGGFFSRHGLSISKLREQSYDGESNMRGEFNESVFYMHCFAHQFQLALVVVAKNHTYITGIFYWITYVMNVIGSSAKLNDILREKQAAKVFKALENNVLSSGQGLNQETSLQRASDTRWGSYYNTILRMISMF
ncbi:hypothetical protein Ddye_030686 [Dipteronia dyeriana]|uniref:DUF4371 domain-containing protein n=1 Tax=Dipteronia dyeriana TaxID=168575 RepID=A0AAD9WLP0_9ROSI|nr:hypothetical protein Ddye_030686 [Dipteronia dyeriana]